ncbi:hypothetical protein Tco_1581783, partial [Tanacetum coccineum]
RNRDNTRRTVPVETSDALAVQDNALIVQDGLGYDWSYIAQDEPTKSALMAYTSGSDTEDWMILIEIPRVEFVRPSGVIIEDWISDDDEDIFQSNDVQTTIKPSFKKIESVRLSGVIIEDWVSDDDDDIFQSNDVQTTIKSSFKKIESVRPSGVIIEDWVSDDDEDISQSNDVQTTVKSDKQAVKYPHHHH